MERRDVIDEEASDNSERIKQVSSRMTRTAMNLSGIVNRRRIDRHFESRAVVDLR
jgi:hypothetical protein